MLIAEEVQGIGMKGVEFHLTSQSMHAGNGPMMEVSGFVQGASLAEILEMLGHMDKLRVVWDEQK